MKKMIVAAVALIFTAGIINAQDSKPAKAQPAKSTAEPAKSEVQPASSQPSKTAKENQDHAKCDMKNCIMMVDGKMIQVKDGKEMPMENDAKLNDGTTIFKDGTCLTLDGKKSRLKNGQCFDMSGKSCMMEKSHGHDHEHGSDHHH